MTEQERKTREACGRWDKGKKKKKNRSGKAGKMIGWFSHQSLKTEKHSDMLEPRESFGSSPGLKSGTGSRQQLLHALHLTHRCQYSIHTEEENLWILQSLTQTETHYHSECTLTPFCVPFALFLIFCPQWWMLILLLLKILKMLETVIKCLFYQVTKLRSSQVGWSQSKKAPRCSRTGNLHYGCVADKSARRIKDVPKANGGPTRY